MSAGSSRLLTAPRELPQLTTAARLAPAPPAAARAVSGRRLPAQTALMSSAAVIGLSCQVVRTRRNLHTNFVANADGSAGPAQLGKIYCCCRRRIIRCILIRTPVCRLCGRYLAILGRPIRATVAAVTVAPTALVGSLIRSSNLPHSLQRGVPTVSRKCMMYGVRKCIVD